MFGDDVAVNTAAGRPAPVPALEWVSAEKLEKERELVGMYLSAHPLDDYYMELNYGCTPLSRFQTQDPVEGSEVTIGGMVVNFTSRAARNGGQFGILKIEDYTGSAEFMMFGQTYINFHNFGVPGTPVIITGKYERRFQSSDLRFNILSVRLLNQMKGQVINSITIDLPREKLTDNLCALLSEHASTGDEREKGTLYVNVYDPSINRSVRLAAGRKLPVNRRLVEMLEGENINFTVN